MSEMKNGGTKHTERYLIVCGIYIEDKELRHYAMPKEHDVFYSKTIDKNFLRELIMNDKYRDVQLHDEVKHTNEILKSDKLVHIDYIKK